MKDPTRNLLVLLRKESMSEQAIEKEVECLHWVLSQTESTEKFCLVNELVDRNRITSSKKRILKESAFVSLRPFRFLINKN